MPQLDVERSVHSLAEAIARAGGRALVVGGYVRDRLLGLPCKDLDIEVFDLSLEALHDTLEQFGEVLTVGRVFGVLRVAGLDIDVSLPRRDSKVAPGHRGFDVHADPGLDFAEAARRRDLTINSIGYDPLRDELLDPHGGRRDLAAGVLRATDPRHFSEDPLRGLRVAQFAARFAMQPDNELRALCSRLDLSELSAERVLEEMRKLLLKGVRPSVGLALLNDTTLLRFFPELQALVGVQQDLQWHPEGDVWTHTLMVVDVAATLRDGGDDDAALMFGALCHDLGKPSTTVQGDDGRVRSPGHDTAGIAPAIALLERMRAPRRLVAQVAALVRHHLAPALFVKGDAGPRGYRRLARKLDAAQVSLSLLCRLARADHWGRTTDEARARLFPAGDAFIERARSLAVAEHGQPDVVLGRHLLAHGLHPGPVFGKILARCRAIQDTTGAQDPEVILAEALRPRSRREGGQLD